MLSVRVIPCLLLRDGGLVKTVKFKNPVYIGDPINAVKIYNEKEVDELIFLDIDASKKGAGPNYDLIKDLATECFMPFAYGGGITKVEHIKKILEVGVEKVILNHSAIRSSELISSAAKKFGSSTVIGAIDIKKNLFGKYKVYSHVNRSHLQTDPVSHAKTLEHAGVGEIFLNFVDRDGTYAGFDIPVIREIAEKVSVPVIACGGAGSIRDFTDVIRSTQVSALAAGSIFVFNGPHRAVLISYPSQDELRKVFNS